MLMFGSGHGASAYCVADDIAGRRRRADLRDFGATLSDHRELRECGLKIRKGRAGSATEILEVGKSCKNKWLCPTCGYTDSWQQAADLKRRLLRWTTHGGAVALLTLTQSHCLEDDLTVLWDRMEHGWAALVRGSGWTADKQAHRVGGYVRVTEVVHNPRTGWNVHFHVALLLAAILDESRMEELRTSIADRFIRGVAGRGGHASMDGQDLKPMAVGTEGEQATYLFKGTTMKWSNGTRTPIAILSDLESMGEGLDLWDELTRAVSARKRKQVCTSQLIDRLCERGPHTYLD